MNSTLQLREVLFDELGLTPQKKTKTGFSTDAASLEKLAGQHPIIEHLLRYREVEKLRSTYGEGLLAEVGARRPHPRHVQPDGGPHRPAQLRRSPNLHNIPVRTEVGRAFRKAFVPADGLRAAGRRLQPDRAALHRPPRRGPGPDRGVRVRPRHPHRDRGRGSSASSPTAVTIEQRSKAKMVSLRPRLRHGGLRPRPAPQHPHRGGAGDPRRLLRGLPGGAGLHGAHRRRGPRAGLHRDAVRPAPPDPRAGVVELPHPPGRRAPGHERRHPGPGRRHLQGGARPPRPGRSTEAAGCRSRADPPGARRGASSRCRPTELDDASAELRRSTRWRGAVPTCAVPARGQPRRRATRWAAAKGSTGRGRDPAGERPTTGSRPLADHLGAAYLRYSFTKGTEQEVDFLVDALGLRAGHAGARRRLRPGPPRPRARPAGGSRSSASTSPQRFVDLAARRRARRGAPSSGSTPGALPFDGEFDAAISLCQGAFGLAGGTGRRPSDRRPGRRPDGAVLDGMARALRPGGRLAVSAFSAYFQVRYLEDARHLRRRRRASTTSAPRCATPTGARRRRSTCGPPASRPGSCGCWPARAGLDGRATSGRSTPGAYAPARPRPSTTPSSCWSLVRPG